MGISSSEAAAEAEAGAPGNEIEITPEMIGAGSYAALPHLSGFSDFLGEGPDVETLVLAVFRAMDAAR